MTPLIMAVLHGHFEIMDVLYNRGERVPEPHVPSCSCPDCKSYDNFFPIRMRQSFA